MEYVNKCNDSRNYTEDELDKVIRAFSDISDSTAAHEFYEQTGISDQESAENYSEAKNILLRKYSQFGVMLIKKDKK